MSNSFQASLELWRAVPFLQGQSDAVLRDLALVSSRHLYSQGQVVFMEGEPTAGIFVVESGIVKITRYAADGREHILLLAGRGDTFNDVSALDGGPNPASAIAFSDAAVWRIARSDLRQVVTNHPDLAWSLIENVSGRARMLVGIVQDLAMRNVKGRLARLLLDQAEAHERGEPPIPLTQEEIANRLGTVREVVGRALRSLAAENAISLEQRQQIVIIDRKRLEAAAEV